MNQVLCEVKYYKSSVHLCEHLYLRVSMGLTDRRKTAKELADSRKN